MIIDACMFFNELDVLEIRLNELYPVVDHFVIAESVERHGSNKPKALLLKENWERFKQFEDKICYVQSPEFPKFKDTGASRWARENFHRNSLMAGIQSLSPVPEDLVILSDCDEIPRATAVNANRNLREMRRFNLDFFYYNVNRYIGNWCRNTIGPLSEYQKAGGLQAVRDITAKYSWAAIDKGGWHFSFFCDVPRLREKAESFAENGEGWGKALRGRSDAEIAADILAGRDVFHRVYYGDQTFSHRDSNDSRLPAHFLNNPERYAHFTEGGFK